MLRVKTREDGKPQPRARVFFTCHPDDYEEWFPKICEDVLRTHDCAIYYTQNMNEKMNDKDREFDLNQMNLFIIRNELK